MNYPLYMALSGSNIVPSWFLKGRRHGIEFAFLGTKSSRLERAVVTNGLLYYDESCPYSLIFYSFFRKEFLRRIGQWVWSKEEVLGLFWIKEEATEGWRSDAAADGGPCALWRRIRMLPFVGKYSGFESHMWIRLSNGHSMVPSLNSYVAHSRQRVCVHGNIFGSLSCWLK